MPQSSFQYSRPRRCFSTLLLAACCARTSSAFSASRMKSLLVQSSSSSSALRNDAGVIDWDGDDNYEAFMNRASSCAGSESCGLEEAESLLDGVLVRVQTKCDTKTCDDVGVAAEIVANLRSKIDRINEKNNPMVTLWSNDKAAIAQLFNVLLSVYVVSLVVQGVAMLSSPVDVLPPPLVLDETTGQGVTPFLPQEIFWALRDGYFPILFKEWTTHGGFSVVDVTSNFDEKVVPFTLQEWFWSIQNGFFGNMVEENLRHGGFLVDSSYESETIPMNAQEVLWSYQGGYLGTAANHFFRNGGV